MLYAIMDYSGTGIDGYGPFHYAKQDWVASYEADGVRYQVFRPGRTVVTKGASALLRHRDPLRYHGECDCPD